MVFKPLSVPPNLLQDQSLNPTQKLILSSFSKKPKQYSLEIAKRLGTRRSNIRDDLQKLVEMRRLFESNGNGRVAYSTSKGFEFNPGEIKNEGDLEDVITNLEDVNAPRRRYSISERNTKNGLKDIINQSNYKFFNSFEDKAALAMQYWLDFGGVRHREHTKVFNQSIDDLIKLFKGEFFDNVPDAHLYRGLLAKHKKFDLEDWKTSLENYKLSLISPAHYPPNKEKAIAYSKKLSLPKYIYNPFNHKGTTKSFFLQFLEPPKLIHAEVVKYKKLTQALIAAFNEYKFQIQPLEPELIRAANMIGDLCKKYCLKHVSLFDTAKILPQFVKNHFEGRVFKPNWLSTDWFKVEFEYYLDRQGLINLNN